MGGNSKNSGYAVSKVSEDDAAAITELINEIIATGEYSAMVNEIPVAEQVEFIRNLPERSIYLKAVAGGKIIGVQDVVPIDETTGEIATFVSLDYFRSAVGSALSAATFEKLTELGYEKIIARIRGDNFGALSFYKSVGFEIVDVAPGKIRIGDRKIDEIITEKKLT